MGLLSKVCPSEKKVKQCRNLHLSLIKLTGDSLAGKCSHLDFAFCSKHPPLLR